MSKVSNAVRDRTVDEIQRDLERAVKVYLMHSAETDPEKFAFLNAIVQVRVLSEELLRWLVL